MSTLFGGESAQKTIDLACESAAKLLYASHAAFLQLDQDELSGTVIAEYPKEIGTVGAVVPIAGVPLEERLVSTAQAVQIDDVDNQPEFDPVAEVMRRFNIKSAIFVPVVVNGRMIGSFSVDSIGRHRVFTNEEVERCSLFALQVQMALQNAFLFEASGESRHRLDLMLRASQAVLEGADLSGLASMIVDLEGVAFCRILLLDENRLSLIVEAGQSSGNLSWDPCIGEFYILQGGKEYEKLLDSPEPRLLDERSEADRGWIEVVSHRLRLAGLLRSLLIVPLVCGEFTIGLLEIGQLRGEATVFDEDRIALASAIASQAAAQIYSRRNHELSERRRQLLEDLERHSEGLVPEREPDKILQETVRLGRSLIGGVAAGLFRNEATHLTLIHANGIPQQYLLSAIPAGEGTVGTVAKTGLPRLAFKQGNWSRSDGWFSGPSFDSLAAVPLSHLGNVAFVLFVGSATGGQRFGQADLEILARLAARAIAAWNSANLLSRDARRMHLLAVLDHSLSFLRGASDLARVYHVILTTVTAGWGLRLNRAILLLEDGWRHLLKGITAIGQFKREDAEREWSAVRERSLNDPLHYLALVRNELPPESEMHKAATELRIPIPTGTNDVFFSTLRDPHPRLFSGGEIPSELSDLLEPETEVVVAPLVVEGETLGVIVGDNKFTREEVTAEDCEVLRSFCDAVASTIQNIRRHDEDYRTQQRLRELLAHSEKLVAPEAGLSALDRILKHSVEAAQADAASVIVRDDTRQFRQLISWPADRADLFEDLCVHWITTEVRTRGECHVIEDLHEQRDILDPEQLDFQYGAAACFPVRSPTRLLAILWLFYKEPRQFKERETADLQSYFNLAGITYDALRRSEETELLLQSARSTSSKMELDDVLDAILEQACKVTGADASTVWPWDHRAGKFLVDKARSRGIPMTELQTPTPGQMTWRILEKGYESSGDPWKGTRHSPATQELLSRHDIRSYQGIVLKAAEERVGVLYVSYKNQNPRRSFWAWERQLLESYSVFAALALRRAQLWQQLNRVKRGVEIVANVTVRGKFKKTLQSLAEQARKAADCDAVTLYVWDPQENRMRFPPFMEGVWFPDRVEKHDEQPLKSLLYEVFAREELSINLAEFRKTRFSRDENIHTCVALPLIFAGKEKTGVLFINYRNPSGVERPREISSDDEEILKLLARQAAVTMHHALLMEQRTDELDTSNRILRGVRALNAAARAIIGSSRDEVLKMIVRHAVQCVEEEGRRPGNVLGALLMFEAETNSLVYREVYPEPADQIFYQSLGDTISLDDGTGITRRAALQREVQNVPDVTKDPDYLCYSVDTRSELAVPLVHKGELIGVLDIESDRYDFFDQHDRDALLGLRDLAVIAIETDRLRRTAEEAGTSYEKFLTEEADKRVIQSLAKGCHDILTPISGISVLLQNFLEGIHGKLEVKEENLAKDALDKIVWISKVIQDVVDIARLRIGIKTNMQLEPSDLGSLLTKVKSEHEEYAARAGINLEMDPPQGVLRSRIYVRALRRVLENLLRNALNYTPSGGIVQLSAQREGNHIIVRVQDSGGGIEPEKLQRLTLPLTHPRSAAGLGMTIVREFVELHNGDIDTRSELGKGTTFAVILPVSAEAEE